MPHSMTGFGKASCSFEGSEISVELSAVNHRFLDCNIRLPYAWSSIEPAVRETIKKHLSRGKVSVTVGRKKGQNSCQSIQFDKAVAAQYVEASKELGELLGSNDSLTPGVLARLEGVFFQSEPEEDVEKIQALVVGAVTEAIEKLTSMREVEGMALAAEISNQVALIRESVANIEIRLPELNKKNEERLRTRIAEFAQDVSITEERIAIEIAIIADKGDVTEEIVRLKTHLDRAEELLKDKEPIGREYNFLTQEIQREINTLGSKVRDTDVVGEVMRMKSELEKIREQVQNIE